jgi:type VI secretion system protein ImpF
MANKSLGSITLPLLDRLTDEEPRRREEAPLSRSKALAALKASLKRDLEWLLNTRRPPAENLPANVARSLWCYGLPEYSAGSEERSHIFDHLARQIESAVSIFEPRLAGIKVMLSPQQDQTSRRIDLVIDGFLRVDPVSERVTFDTSLELSSGEYHVRGTYGGG